jgi:hypothetical protein
MIIGVMTTFRMCGSKERQTGEKGGERDEDTIF